MPCHVSGAALDQLAWQLALLNKKAPSRRTSFPIQSRESHEQLKDFARATRDISSDATSEILRLQPFQWSDYHKDPLWQLDELWNLDKHRLIVVPSMYIKYSIPSSVKLGPADAGIRAIDDGFEHFALLPISVKPQMERAPNPKAGGSFGTRSDPPVQPDDFSLEPEEFGRLFDYVEHEVFPLFERFF